MNRLLRFVCVLLLAAVVQQMQASDHTKGTQSGIKKNAAGGPFSTLVNINNISMWVSHDGNSARNPSTGNSGVTFPRGTGTSIYADGLVWGGMVHDGGSQVLRVNGTTYQSGLVGGRILSKGVAEPADAPSVRIFRIRRNYETADLRQDAAELLSKALKDVTDGDMQAVRDQYRTDWLEWPAAKGAPYYDRNGNGIYDPDPSGSYDPTKDEPGVADADQVVWFVVNDLNEAQSLSFEGSEPIGLETQVTLWGYARTDALGNVIFKQFKYIYKGTASSVTDSRIDDMYVGQFADPDLGNYSDDLVACDTTRNVFGGLGKVTNLGFVYNSTSTDEIYKQFKLPPPAMGYDFFAGPVVPDENATAVFNLQYRPGYRNLGMSSWIYFAASGTYSDPPFSYVGAGQWYNLLRGLTPIDGSPFEGLSGPTKYWLSGDPVAGTGDLDGTIDPPGDRRMMLSTGPFSMALGDTQCVVIALVGGLGSDRLSSVSALRFNDLSAQFAFDVLFELPKAPPMPHVQVSNLDKAVVLNWGFDPTAVSATENDDNKGYKFEGYNVYQLPSPTASSSQAIKLQTFDLPTDPTTVLDPVFDIASGQVLTKPTEIGSNSGLSRVLILKDDKIREKPLVNGQSYYFAVTAYNFYAGTGSVPTHALENPIQVIEAVPQAPFPGVRYRSVSGDTIKSITHTGPSDGIITPIVVEPSRITGHEYQVSFAIDTVSSNTYWVLTDATATRQVLTNQFNQTDDGDYLIVDGMQVKVAGPPPGMKSWSIPSGTRRFSPVGGWFGLGLEGFSSSAAPAAYDVANGTIGMAGHFGFGGVGTTLTNSQYHTVVLKLANVDHSALWDPKGTPTDTNYSLAYRWLRHAGAPADPSFAPWIISTGTGYPYQDFNYAVPFSAWDMETNPPTRLAVGMFENNDPGASVDGRYWPPLTDGDNSINREFCFIFAKPYSTTPDPAFETNLSNNASLPMMWVMTCNRRADVDWTSNDQFEISANHVNAPGDVFSFATPGNTSNEETARTDITKINVFPNPYYGFNRTETSRFARKVTFNHLPPNDWRIRIFTLAGNLVRYLDPNSQSQDPNSQFATWDLNNSNGLAVASGIYVVYVDMPKLGVTKTLKLVVVQEQQVLQYY